MLATKFFGAQTDFIVKCNKVDETFLMEKQLHHNNVIVTWMRPRLHGCDTAKMSKEYDKIHEI